MRPTSLVDALLPRELPHDLEAVRARFFVAAWLLTLVVGVVMVAFYAAFGPWTQGALITVLVVSAPAMLWLHRRGWSRTGLAHASMALATLVFGGTPLTQLPPDYTGLTFLAVVPLLGSFILGPRQSLVWLVMPIVVGVASIWAADHLWVLPIEDPSPTFSHALSFGEIVLLTWLFARRFDALGARAVAREREAARTKSAFLATVSHEIRTPMNGVLGMTEVLLQDEGLTGDQREQLTVIQRSGRALVALINDVLDVSKIEAGRMTLESIDFSLDAVLSDVKALHGALAEQKGLDLEVWVDPALRGRLKGDALRLGQVLGNLVHNAIKFTSRGTVRLGATRTSSARPQRMSCEFSVEDTGVGISAEQQARLFTRFEQGDSSTTRRYGGTGLGLALCQQLVTLMGGHIDVHSRPGAGSRFEFTLELELAPAARGASAPATVSRPGAPLAVLVVDDNEVNLRVARRLAEICGYQVDVARSGSEALLAVGQKAYAVVLMDCHMPEMDGFEATERIRATMGAWMPILALTASAMPDEVAACERAGMNEVIVKPITLAGLREALARWARPPAADAQARQAKAVGGS